MSVLVTKGSWNVTQLHGCCGAGVLSRIKGVYVDSNVARRHLELWYKTNPTEPVINASQLARLRARPDSIKALLTASKGTVYQHRISTATGYNFAGIAWEKEIVFYGVLQDMLSNKYSMYLMADNVGLSGDVHTGPCATRHFANWLQDMGYGAIHTAGPVDSLRTGAPLQGWIFHPAWSIVTSELIAEKADEMYNKVKEIQSVESLKQRQQQELHSRARRDDSLRATLDEAWGF